MAVSKNPLKKVAPVKQVKSHDSRVRGGDGRFTKRPQGRATGKKEKKQ